ncbi:MAG: transporter substrate-binding domain-containing protein [Candidatus Gastranaerophilales bacterium]|nr:transporter substrate-binding domain-containing protein [Candidatus Gastranaerophilales bacterium]
MKKVLILILMISVCFLTACSIEPEADEVDVLKAAQERGKFIVGVGYDSKPFGFLNEKNELDGFDIDIAKRIASSVLGSEKAIEYVEIKSGKAISSVSSGKVDFLVDAMTITPQRQITIAFSEPYYTTGQAMLVKKDSKINTVKDLNKKKVIVLLNTTSEQTPKKYAPAAILIGFKTREECFKALKNNEGEAMISDEALLKSFVTANPDYKILPQKLSVEPYGIAVKNTDEAKNLKKEIDAVLNQMKTDGSLEELKQKWNL